MPSGVRTFHSLSDACSTRGVRRGRVEHSLTPSRITWYGDRTSVYLMAPRGVVMLRKFLVTFCVLTLPAVAAADVRVDYDRHKDFGRYRTFDVEIGSLVRSDGVPDDGNTLAENR